MTNPLTYIPILLFNLIIFEKKGPPVSEKSSSYNPWSLNILPLSSYMFFCDSARQALSNRFPNDSMGDISKKLGKMWHSMDNSKRSKFEKKSAEDKIRYKEDMEYYNG